MRRWSEGAQFTPQFKRKVWDGYVYPGTFDHSARLTMGRGLLERALHDLNATIVGGPPAVPLISLDARAPILADLRDYQKEALETIFRKKWGCIALATNAGKGAIIALAAKAISESLDRVLICCDEVSVFDALEEQIRKWANLYPATITAGLRVPPKPNDCPIVLAMVPTLYRRIRKKITEIVNGKKKVRYECLPEWKEWLEETRAVFLDEADKATSQSWQWLLRYLPNTDFRIGTSGTFPSEENLEELTIHETIGPILQKVRNIELVERGISARPTVEMCPYEQQIELPPRNEWREMDGPTRRLFVYEQGVVLNEERHRFIADLLEPDQPNAVVVNYLEHGRQLEQILPDSVFLSGDDPPEVRRAVLDRFKKGEFKTLIVSKILDRGTNDLGHAVGLIFASSQGSDRQTLQRIGRGLRRAGGKEFLFLKDIIDRGHKYLEKASKQRVVLYNEEGFDVRIHTDTHIAMAGIGIRVRADVERPTTTEPRLTGTDNTTVKSDKNQQ